MGRTILEVEVTDVEKRRDPSKHYVYVINITWSDGTKNVIYRRYSNFFDFQSDLLDTFPEEGGAYNPSDRTIPFLPGKIFFARSHIREVAMKRLKPINDYCKKLVRLPGHISQCSEVLDFFHPTAADLNPPKKETKPVAKISKPKSLEQYCVIQDHEKREKGEVTLRAGMVVEVLEKDKTGWWFVNTEDEQGWAPSTLLERIDGDEDESEVKSTLDNEERYKCNQRYVPQGPDEIALEEGDIVDVVEKTLDGWWLVSCHNDEGWAPAAYLNLCVAQCASNLSSASAKVEIVGTLADVSNLLKDRNSQVQVDVNQEEPSTGDDDQRKSSRMMNAGVEVKSKSLKRRIEQPPPRQRSMEGSPTRTFPLKPKMEYYTVADLEDTVGDGISFSAGEKVDEILEKSDSGWWYVQIEEKTGWVPASYLEIYSGDSLTTEDSQRDAQPTVCAVPPADSTQPDERSLADALRSKLAQVKQKPVQPLKNTQMKQQGFTAPVCPALPARNSSLGSGDSHSSNLVNALKARVNMKRDDCEDQPKPDKPKVPARDAVPKSKLLQKYGNQGSRPHPAKPGTLAVADSPMLPAKPAVGQKPKLVLPIPVKPSMLDNHHTDKATKNRINAEGKPGNTDVPVVPSKGFALPKQQQKIQTESSSRSDGSESCSVKDLRSRFNTPVASKPLPQVPSKPKPGNVRNHDSPPTQRSSSSGHSDSISTLKEKLKSRLDQDSLQKPLPKPPSQKTQPINRHVPYTSIVKPLKTTYVTVASFTAFGEAEISFESGMTADVLEKSDEGWWWIRVGADEGWAPSDYLELCQPSVPAGSTRMDTSKKSQLPPPPVPSKGLAGKPALQKPPPLPAKPFT